MKTYTLNFEHKLPIPLAEAWDFFSSPLNLAKITPAEMKFKVTSNYTADTKIYPGMLITYKVTPLLGVQMDWVTEITHIKDQEYFIDEQRFGPYAMWHHEHHFEEIKGGIKMIDKLTYGIPYGIIGQFSNALFVGKKVEDIFTYREKAINDLFGIYKEL